LSTSAKNPWVKEGVSILREDTNDLLPIVGQKELFGRLKHFCEECTSTSNDKLTGFFVLHGGWGVGKSRVGHEVCLEALNPDVSWIVEREPQRILEPALKQGLLPIFIRYVQVTTEFDDKLGSDTWIPAATVEALSRLAGMRAQQNTGNLSKNQDRLIHWTQQVLRPKGWDDILDRLKNALKVANVNDAARKAIGILKEIGIHQLLIVVDEIEDISDVDLDGLPDDERKAIKQELLTVIPRVIKSEEDRQQFPNVNFLLLCSRAVGDLLRQIGAIKRRTVQYTLRSNTFSDVEDFFDYLKRHRPQFKTSLESYPAGLKEAAFFAADRNFGWFNHIMHYMHLNQRGNSIPTYELMRRFANNDEHVFRKDAIGSYDVDLGTDKSIVEEMMYGLLPRRIGTSDLSETRAKTLLDRRTADKVRLFGKLREIKPPQDMRITTHLINCGFKTEPGAIIYLPGEARFNLKEVMDSLKSFSQIALPHENVEHLLISENDTEFTAQVSALSPYGDQAAQFAPYLHGLLTESAYEVRDDSNQSSEYLAPSFTFLQRFHQLNNRQQRDEGLLRDSAKNTKLIEEFDTLLQSPKERQRALLCGIANAWDLERAPVAVNAVDGLALPAISISTSLPPLSIGPDGAAILIYGTAATDPEIEQTLTRLGKQVQPIVLVLEDEDNRILELRERIARATPKVSPFVVIHNLTRQVADKLAQLGLMGKAFSDSDLRTTKFNGVIQNARQHLEQELKLWKDDLDQQGLILRPLFYGSKVSEEEIEAFSKGYAAMLGGKSYHDVKQSSSGVFANDTERDSFDKLVARQIEPGPRFQDAPRTSLVVVEGGENVAKVPRCFLSLMERCSHVGRTRGDLEKSFLFDLHESVRARDVVGHQVLVEAYLGLLSRDSDETVRQVSGHVLQSELQAADDWLDSRFEAAVQSIKAIHQDEGARLMDIKGKDARDRLKRARKELEDLSLDFVGKAWSDLNRETSDGMPAYEQGLRKALSVVVKVKLAVKSVFDTEGDRAFRYAPAVLLDFEQQQNLPTYPLWRRVKVLHGFYSEVEKKRRELIKQIAAITEDVDRRVPELSDGQKAFPTQALMRPLGAFKQELDFSADKPNKTVTAGGSSFAIMTVGYKICDGKYREAFERLDFLEAQLTHPGKLVAGFKELLNAWESLRNEVRELDDRLKSVEAFFADAPDDVKNDVGIDDLRSDLDDLRVEICEGGIRQGTDNREAAGQAILTLVDGLKADLDKVRNGPANLRERLQGKEAQAVQSLEVAYQSKYAALIKATAGIRSVRDADPLRWPDVKADTFGATKALFDAMVQQMQSEGELFFADVQGTNFQDYQGLCKQALAGKAIDWDGEYERHVNPLKRLKLLELKLK